MQPLSKRTTPITRLQLLQTRRIRGIITLLPPLPELGLEPLPELELEVGLELELELEPAVGQVLILTLSMAVLKFVNPHMKALMRLKINSLRLTGGLLKHN